MTFYNKNVDGETGAGIGKCTNFSDCIIKGYIRVKEIIYHFHETNTFSLSIFYQSYDPCPKRKVISFFY